LDNRERYVARRAHEDSLREHLLAASRAHGRLQALAEGKSAARSLGRLHELPPVDVDVATEEELAAVPGIGPAFARRIVTDRIAHGPFGSLDELQRVRGITAPLARRMASWITFSRAPAPDGGGATGPRPPQGRRPRTPRWQ
jgi:hypothetical protein